MSAAKILLLDLETAPMLIAAWRQWDTSAVYVLRNTYILMYAYQWLGDRDVKCVSLPDFKTYKRDKHCDKELCLSLRELLNEADIVVAHNGQSFDLPMVLGRMWANAIPPSSPFKQIDTLKIAKNMRLDSRKLDALGQTRGLGRKIATTGAALWRAVTEDHCPKAWATMVRYCKQDIRLLASVYPTLRPYAKPSQHPDLNMWSDRPGCPVCSSTHVKKDGWKLLRKRRVQQWQCQEVGCGKYFSD